MIAPDRHVGDFGNVDACFLSELCLRAVFVEHRHCEPTIIRDTFCVVHRDQAVGVARVADDENADIGSSVACDRFTLSSEDLTIDTE